MRGKLYLALLALGIVLVFIGYFYTHPSYEISLRAKIYYELGDYDRAYELSQEAFMLDRYNKMATTLMAQSKISKRYADYIEDAKIYLDMLDHMADQDSLSSADRARIRTVCEIMISTYRKLSPSVITDKSLVDEAKELNVKFERLLEKANQ